MKPFIKSLLREGLREAEYNYHIGQGVELDNHPRPHGSDGIEGMSGRGTGHLGSGLYFSSYTCKEKHDYDDKYGEWSQFDMRGGGGANRPQLIKIIDGGENLSVYRVDLDLYKNLYRVVSNEHGHILFRTLNAINTMFYSVGNQYEKEFKLYDNFSKDYIKLKHNLTEIGLDLPKYRDFIKLLQKAHGDIQTNYKEREENGSMSTRVMEWNGYNGVNVSGVYEYDNTTHGSVIYDMSKIDSTPREVKKPDMFCKIERGVASRYGDINSELIKILNTDGELTGSIIDRYNKIPKNEQLVFMKRYNKFMGHWGDGLSPEAKSIYLKTMPHRLRNLKMEGDPEFEVIKYLVDSGNINLIYNSNIKVDGVTFLQFVIDNAYANYLYDEQFMINIIKGIPRKLTPDEQMVYDYNKQYWT